MIPRLIGIEEDEDEWVPAKAAFSTLSVISQICGELITPQLRQFIRKNIVSNSLPEIIAAILAIAAISEDNQNLKIIADLKYYGDEVIRCLDSREKVLRENAAWCLSKITQNFQEDISKSLASTAMTALLLRFNDDRKVIGHSL